MLTIPVHIMSQKLFIMSFCHGDRKFSTFSLNVRSLPNKWCDFRDIVSNLNGNNFKFSVVAIQEV